MKEMLFIMVAVLIPPTLTYLGVIESETAESEAAWSDPQLDHTAAASRERPERWHRDAL